MKVTENADPNKYECSGYSTGFDAYSDFSINSKFGENVIIFSVDNISSLQTDHRKRKSC